MIPSRIYIIAEAGVNHNGSMQMALKLIDAAHRAGADAIKFQTFKAEKLVSAQAQKADYQKASTGSGSQLEMLSKLELSPDNFRDLAAHAKRIGIEFLSSAFDEESLDLVVSLGVSKLKLGSGELTNGSMLYACAKSKLPLILSTGMATIAEIQEALSLLAQSYLSQNTQPNPRTWSAAFTSEEGRNALRERVTLLHCTTEYPCPLDQVDLRAMDVLANTFNLPVGYSDHTAGITVSLAASARGATVIEKHMTLDTSLPGPDHKASIDPVEFTEMVKGIRDIELSLGREEKIVHASEIGNMMVARRSLVAQAPIAKGEIFTVENLSSRRPGNGISPMRLWDLIGKRSSRDYASGALIEDGELTGRSS